MVIFHLALKVEGVYSQPPVTNIVGGNVGNFRLPGEIFFNCRLQNVAESPPFYFIPFLSDIA